MAIAPIGGLSSYSPISSVQPMNYAIDNDADFSDVYTNESVKNGASVTGTSPVQYPNVTVQEIDRDFTTVDPYQRQKRNIQVSSDFNDIATKFLSGNTSYGVNGRGSTYNTSGSRFDAYA
ncbi:hypothetical protein [Pseudobutyrivibrio ruminis]|uniref:hypothetical protein n=1 Tax=Pseudobutyrivibrio ruminis TaxID=46206 RepID=UPI000402DEF7|nr:hypothetical protein [Pseudobutyrivibrio ruminis]